MLYILCSFTDESSAKRLSSLMYTYAKHQYYFANRSSYLFTTICLLHVLISSGRVVICHVLSDLLMTLFSYYGPNGGVSLPQQRQCNIMPLLCGIDCVLSKTTAGVKTRRVLRARGAGLSSVQFCCGRRREERIRGFYYL